MRTGNKKGSARELERERLGTDIAPPPPFVLEKPADWLDTILEKSGMDEKLWEHKLGSDWKNIVGSQLAEHTRPGRYINRALTIYVDSSPWLRALEMDFKDMIKGNLQNEYGKNKIRDVYFAIDPGE